MPRARYDEPPHENAGLVEGGLERLGLGRGIDHVVGGAVHEQEARPVAVDGGIAQRGGVEIDPPVLHRRCAEIFFRDLVARPRDLVVVPLRQHVVDAVKADHRFHIGFYGGIRIAAILGRKLIGRDRHQSRQVRTGGISHQADALRIEAQFARLGAHELNGGFDVIGAGRIGTRLAEPIVDREQRVAVSRQERPPIFVAGAAAPLPAAAVNRHDHRSLVQPLRQIEVAGQAGAVALGEGDIRSGYDLEIPRGSTGGRKHGKREDKTAKRWYHGKLPC